MSKDRFIQLLAALIACGCLLGGAAMVPMIHAQRRDLQLSFDFEGGGRQPPKYVLAAAALGSFRGLAVDILWYRLEMLKRAGKFYEAYTLSQWITTLQPRFPQVWAFHAWNMAYNISVATHTPAERWSWVSKGINLLRDEGVVYNPASIRIYRELSWIFLHKLAGNSDDMHWHYKVNFAREWQEVLGAPTEGATQEQAAEAFAPIAQAADRYFNLDRPSRAMRDELERLAEEDADLSERFYDLMEMDLVRFMDRLGRLRTELERGGRYELARRLGSLMEQAQARLARATHDSLALLEQDAPAVTPVVQQLRAMGLEPGEAVLRQMGRLEMLLRYVSVDRLLSGASPVSLSEQDRQLLRWRTDPQNQSGLAALKPFLRAKVLVERYHMDPSFMLELMETFGPIDWRHPASHAIYWTNLGLRRAEDLIGEERYDLLNTGRNSIHAFQELMRSGQITFDPLSGDLAMFPDPRFIDAYEKMVFQAEEAAQRVELATEGTLDTFDAGHENFLLKAIVMSYLYGNREQAQAYYDKVRRLYGDKPHNLQDNRYLMPLDDLVATELQRDYDLPYLSRAFVDSFLQRAIHEGLGYDRMDRFDRFLRLARSMYQIYQEKRDYTNPNAGEGRLALPPFDTLLTEAYINYMRLPQVDLLRRVHVYRNTPPQLLAAAYPRLREVLAEQARLAGLDPDRAFPPPSFAPQMPQSPSQMLTAPPTVERQ